MSLVDPASAALAGFVALCGDTFWTSRLSEIGGLAKQASWRGRAAQQRHALELLLGRLRSRGQQELSPAERRVFLFAEEAVRLADSLPEPARERLRERLMAGLTGEATLIPLFHLLRAASLHRARGFAVRFSGLAGEAAYDLLIEREGVAAEVVCETVSAETGRPVARGDWCTLMDRVNPELQTWLAAHPGRYLLKITLPEGISGPDDVSALHERISGLLQDRKRQDSSAAAVLKLDPLVLAGAQAAMPAHLRAQFGPEAHLAVTPGGPAGSVFVMAARAGRENEVAVAVCRAMRAAAAERLTGERPGILSMFVEDVDKAEWRGLRERLELEGAARRFLTEPIARRVVTVACASRMELLGLQPPDAAEEGELRFRNPAHPAAKLDALAPAVRSAH